MERHDPSSLVDKLKNNRERISRFMDDPESTRTVWPHAFCADLLCSPACVFFNYKIFGMHVCGNEAGSGEFSFTHLISAKSTREETIFHYLLQLRLVDMVLEEYE